MFKRYFILLSLLVLMSTGVASAQEGGSTLAAWADVPASAFSMSQQVEWPYYQVVFEEFNTYTATGDPTPSCVSGHAYSLWHTFVAPQTGKITVHGAGWNFDSLVAVYKTSAADANEVACFNTSATTYHYDGGTINVKAGTRYYVMFAAVGTGVGVGSDATMWTRYHSNDTLEAGFVIPPAGVYSNVQEHIETASAAYYATATCANRNYTVYYKFRPTASGRYEFSTQNSSYDTVIGLYHNGGVIACHDDISIENRNSRLRATMQAGQTYYLIIGQSINATPVRTDNLTLSLRVRRLS